MRDFYFHSPATLDDALTLLDEHQDDGRPMAGGTALIVLMKQSLVDADHIISLGRVPGRLGGDFQGCNCGQLGSNRDGTCEG